MKVLITGGAGFIGSHLTNHLLKENYHIIVIDNLLQQVHGRDKYNSYSYQLVKGKVEFIEEDITNSPTLKKLISEIDFLIHLASETATGQSMYNLNNILRTNSLGTANILETILKNKNSIKKFILASSAAVYGEGKYRCIDHDFVYPKGRSLENLQKGLFDCFCPICNRPVEALPVDENSPLFPKSIYGITKDYQEKLVKTVCTNIHLPYSIFRFQNVYGKGQSFFNPYMGIISIFLKLMLENAEIKIFEDGRQSRDFIHVSDIVTSISNDLNSNFSNQIYNLGSGNKYAIIEIVKLLSRIMNINAKYSINNSFRIGDIRHMCADISKAEKYLNFIPRTNFEDELNEMKNWITASQNSNLKRIYNSSLGEMKKVKMYFE